jgi:hypothetical protein
MDEVKGRVVAACCLDELLGDTSVSERFVYIKIVGSPNMLFVAFVQHRQLSSCELHDPTGFDAKGKKRFSSATLILP